MLAKELQYLQLLHPLLYCSEHNIKKHSINNKVNYIDINYEHRWHGGAAMRERIEFTGIRVLRWANTDTGAVSLPATIGKLTSLVQDVIELERFAC